MTRGEVVVYQNETTSICLERAVLSNESEDQLYLIFHYDYDLPESGSELTHLPKTTTGAYTNTVDLRSRDITATDSVYPDSAALRGPAERFAPLRLRRHVQASGWDDDHRGVLQQIDLPERHVRGRPYLLLSSPPVGAHRGNAIRPSMTVTA